MTTPVSHPSIKDYLTGKPIPDVGAESHRQAVLRYLVEEKRYRREALWVDAPIHTAIGGRPYHARIDLIVKAAAPLTPFMAFKCCAGSLGSREREILAAARIFGEIPIPFSVVTDGQEAIILETLTGKTTARGLSTLPSPQEAARQLARLSLTPYAKDRREREKLIFRTYDQDNVNIVRPDEAD